ncbi:MAG: DUF4007 family protein [Pseudanabaena sp.]|jgi:hypothetical protein
MIQTINSNTSSGTELIFARHETFYPRYGWLKKGFEAVHANSNIFLEEDAHIQLGVGKNMAKAIRYWCGAFKLIEDDRTGQLSPQTSQFGRLLLGEDGYDPFLEDTASLWLLHWHLSQQPCKASAWYAIFNNLRQTEFTVDDLLLMLIQYRDAAGNRTVEASLKKDITCLLRMYVRQGDDLSLNEDNLDCPFAELGLIQRVGDAKHYLFRTGAKTSLPHEILVSACLDFAKTVNTTQRTISLSSLLFDEGSPGTVFKLSEAAICDAIEQVARWCNEITFSDSAGIIQMSFTQDPAKLSHTLLNRYYRP